jgi:putative endonuclease
VGQGPKDLVVWQAWPRVRCLETTRSFARPAVASLRMTGVRASSVPPPAVILRAGSWARARRISPFGPRETPQCVSIVLMKRPAVYLMTNERRTVLYAGVTADLVRRVSEHRSALDPGAFTSRYRVRRLVYFETFDDMETAIRREKQIKGWLRRRKVALIESRNPEWRDLWTLIAG